MPSSPRTSPTVVAVTATPARPGGTSISSIALKVIEPAAPTAAAAAPRDHDRRGSTPRLMVRFGANPPHRPRHAVGSTGSIPSSTVGSIARYPTNCAHDLHRTHTP